MFSLETNCSLANIITKIANLLLFNLNLFIFLIFSNLKELTKENQHKQSSSILNTISKNNSASINLNTKLQTKLNDNYINIQIISIQSNRHNQF